ncbi:RNA-binding protein [Gryllus bimaculatus]|nr:RNA-binding protein [Gryllus bimaculatus]
MRRACLRGGGRDAVTGGSPADAASTGRAPLQVAAPTPPHRARFDAPRRAVAVCRSSCKIKALRAKTNTYIKTPVRGEEPVFVVTGRKEDVAKAKREILSAAEHFSQIRASRKNNLGGGALGVNASAPPGPPANVPGHVTIQGRMPGAAVPYLGVVGLVVGAQGRHTLQAHPARKTQTYNRDAGRDNERDVRGDRGCPRAVETARRRDSRRTSPCARARGHGVRGGLGRRRARWAAAGRGGPHRPTP